MTDRKFTGQTEDDIIGLYWYQSRAFDPVIGRFCTPDTIVPDSMNPQALNRYSYVYNNPLKYIDPKGRDPNWQAHVEDAKAKIEDDKFQRELYNLGISPNQLDDPPADYSYATDEASRGTTRGGASVGASDSISGSTISSGGNTQFHVELRPRILENVSFPADAPIRAHGGGRATR